MRSFYAAALLALIPLQITSADQHEQAIDNWALHRLDRPNVGREFKDSAIVFEGKVLSARNLVKDGMTSGTFYNVQIAERFKGRVTGVVSIYSENSSGRYDMKVGTQYLIFAYLGRFDGAEGLTLSINCAGNSGEWSEAKVNLADLKALQKNT